MIKGINALTNYKKSKLHQGCKVRFVWHGSDVVQIGRIEVHPLTDELYYVPEHNYVNDKLSEVGETMQYYNRLDSYFHFNEFDVIT